MGPRYARVAGWWFRVTGSLPAAGWFLISWGLMGSTVQAESWVLHLPMVVGSVAPFATPQLNPAQLAHPGFEEGSRRGVWSGPLPNLERGPGSPGTPEILSSPGAPGGPRIVLPETGYSPWDSYGGWEAESPLEDLTELDLLLEPTDEWTWQVMPIGLLYRSYLAGAKEPRFSSYLNRDTALGQIWDASLGGRIGILRYGNQDLIRPEGWQIDLEGASQARLDPIADSTPLLSVDFRVGIPVTWAQGPWQFKTGYHHISAHLGDEFLLLFPDARRLNYTRDSIMLGVGYFWTESIRLYGEAAYAVSANDGAEPWEMQFGIDWVPAHDTGVRGAPFAAINGHLREEVNFGGNLVVQGGWAWRRHARGSLFRTGIQYYRGKSDQYEYFDHSERRIGWGMWADF